METFDIGLLGGTGPEGRGLALRFAMAGRTVVIGSRDCGRAAAAAENVNARADGISVGGAPNEDVARRSEIVMVAVPYAGQRPTLEALSESLVGKLVVTVVAPVAMQGGIFTSLRVPEGSAAEQAAALLPGSQVAAAFHNVSARDLLRPDGAVDSDVLVFADDAAAMSTTCGLVSLIPGARAVNAGGLANSRYAEDLTALLLNINRIHSAHASIRITGI